jgi:hypothetical protein
MAQQTGATTMIPTTPPPCVTTGQTTSHHHHHQHVGTASFIVTVYFRPLLAQEQPPVQEPAAPADDIIG